MQGFPNNRCPIKPLLKNSAQICFQGSTPWVTQILNNVIVWMVLYCAHKLLGWKKSQPIIHLLWVKLVHWLFHDISIGLLCYFCRTAMGFTMGLYEISMRYQWYFHAVTMGFLWGSFGIPMIFLCYTYAISMGFLWGFDKISMGGSLEILLHFKGMSMGFPLDSYGNLYGIL